ncbi:hypothetical protein [Tabrizicola sp.]|uniref:hypothetical protein n=1 Tax=Tabrizicola sp. TaxID=2005166 RepID=UPI0035AE9E21
MTPPVAQSAARPTILRLLAAMAAGNQLWEVPHVPLYTLWVTGSPRARSVEVQGVDQAEG